jgi:hypothetical protein
MRRLAFFLVVPLALCLALPAAAQEPGRSPIAELTASDGKTNSSLGLSVAISNGTVFAGSVRIGRDAAIYVFERPATGWRDMTQNAKLMIPSNPQLYQSLAIAASGDTVVGSVLGAGPNGYGALYVFEKPAGGWKDMTPTAVLSPTFGDLFGLNVAMAGDAIVAGDPACTGNGDFGPGTALLFQKPAGGWHDMNETAVLSASDGYGCDDYGISVGASGNFVVVGATHEEIVPGPGKVYVFEKPASGWKDTTQTAELSMLEGFPGDFVGNTVAIGGDTVVSRLLTPNGYPGILVFEKPAGGWHDGTQAATILHAGQDMAVNPQGTAVATATDTYTKINYSVAKVYVKPAGGWQNRPNPTVRFFGTASSGLGSTIALSEVTLAAGAPGLTINGHPRQGGVFLYPK